jgi:hypothetical protein
MQPTLVGNGLYGAAMLSTGEHIFVGDGQTALTMGTDGGWSGSDGLGYRSLNDVWADGDGGAWAVGWAGLIRRYQSGAWSDATSPTNDNLVGVSGSSSSDVWAIGEIGTLLHYDGTAWTVVPGTGASSGPNTAATAIWAAAPNDVWITAGSFIVHYDGTTFTDVPNDASGEYPYTFTSVWGTGPGQAWFTSAGGPYSVWTLDPSTMHVTPVTTVSMWNARSISGTGPNDVWAAGDYDFVHFDGTTWNVLATDQAGNTTTQPGLPARLPAQAFQFGRVRAFAPNDVWLLGGRGLLAAYDGTGWSLVWGQDDAGTDVLLMSSIAGRSSSDVWVGGRDGTRHFDGQSWTFEPSGDHWSEQNTLFADVSGQNVFRVMGTNAWDGTLDIEHLDASGWTSFGQVQGNMWTQGWASGPSDVYILTKGTNSTLYHYDGKAFAPVALPCNATSCYGRNLENIAGSAPDNVWIVGAGSLFRFDGTAWTALAITNYAADITDEVYSVWTDGKTHGWIGGAGVVFEVSGNQVTQTSLGGHEELLTLVGRGSGDLFVAGGSAYQVAGLGGVFTTQRAYGCVFHFDGTSWTEQASGSGPALGTLWVSPDDGSVWGLTGGGVVRQASR